MPSATALAPGTNLGNYTLLEKIGAGAMGMVFKAEHRRMKRVVAVKVLSPSLLENPAAVKRFYREVEVVARLSHPNIVTAFDADEHEGFHFLVMEYVEGIDLDRHVKRHGRLTPEQGANYVVQAARGLEHAHQQRIVHRDVKPANLLLDSAGTLKILDLGLARLRAEINAPPALDEASAITMMGSVMGTVDFMSPEQSLDSRNADESSDVYSLGCTLWYLLTGKPMYGGATIMARLIAHRETPIPSFRAAQVIVPPQIEAIFRRMVAKKKDYRYSSMTKVIRDLGNWQSVKLVTKDSLAKPDSPRASQDTATGQDPPKNVIDAIFDD